VGIRFILAGKMPKKYSWPGKGEEYCVDLGRSWVRLRRIRQGKIASFLAKREINQHREMATDLPAFYPKTD